MANGHRCLGIHEQLCHGFSHNITSPNNNSAFPSTLTLAYLGERCSARAAGGAPSGAAVAAEYRRTARMAQTVGTVVEDKQLLALEVPAGRHDIKLRYWPRRLTLGLWVSILGLLLSLAYLARSDIRAAIGRRP